MKEWFAHLSVNGVSVREIEWDAAWKKAVFLCRKTLLKCIECCDLLCGVWLKWKSNPWTVLGIRSRQYCNSFNGYSPAVYFPFFFCVVYLLSLFNAIVSISVVSSHINRCARYPQYGNYIKALLRTRIALAFSFFSDSTHQICNTNTQQIYLHLGSCITDTQNPNGNDIIYFILSHKYNSGLSDSYLILYTKYGCTKMRCTNNFRSNVSKWIHYCHAIWFFCISEGSHHLSCRPQ